MQKKRLIWLDWGKAFLIYLMIVGHSAPDKVSDTIICSFHMCAFFFLSGVLHKIPMNKIEFIHGTSCKNIFWGGVKY